MTYSTNLIRFAHAIAAAEGYYVKGSVPQRANNPGDLKPAEWMRTHGWTGEKTGAEGIAIFATPEDGWNILYHQLQLIVSKTSHVYVPTMTIAQMAAKWTDTQSGSWAVNVANQLGGHVTDVIGTLLV